MTNYTASDFCQGHGGGRECTYDPQFDGCLQHGDMDHGIVSYCDGSCPEAREHYLRYLRVERNWSPTPSAQEITLEAWGKSLSYQVTFEGPQAEVTALAYMSARKGLHFSEVFDRPFCHITYPRMADALYPQCHHGLDLSLCMDPYGDAHFGTREQELANGW